MAHRAGGWALEGTLTAPPKRLLNSSDAPFPAFQDGPWWARSHLCVALRGVTCSAESLRLRLRVLEPTEHIGEAVCHAGEDSVGLSEIEFELAYKQRESAYERLLEEALSIMRSALRVASVPVSSIAGRVKTLESASGKFKRQACAEEADAGAVLDAFTDMVGTRIVCPFPGNIGEVRAVIAPYFEVLEVDDKIAGYADSPTGYQSLHMTLRLRADYVGPRYDDIKHMPFELQVRTICMDAWANVSHELAYKNETDASPEIRADFRALSGLFCVADKEFGRLATLSGAATERLSVEYRTVKPKFFREDVTIESLGAYLKERFPNREHADRKYLAQLAPQLREAGIGTIGLLEELLVRRQDEFDEYEEEHPPANAPEFTDIGVIRCMLKLDQGTLPAPTALTRPRKKRP